LPKINPFQKEFTHSVTMVAIFLFPVTFLTVRHGVHVSLFALALLAVYHFLSSKSPRMQLNYPLDAVIFLTFSGLFIAVLLSQVFRGVIHFAAFDGPSRILVAGVVFLLIRRLNIPYIKVLSIAIPVGLICVFLSVQLNPGAYWGQRYATYFVDPNTLGSQTFILGLLSFLMIGWGRKKSMAIVTLQVLGGLLGLYVSVGSASRGGWLTAPFILLVILFLRLGDIAQASQSQKQKMWLQTIAVCVSIFIVFSMGFYFSEKLSTRIISGYFEILNWISGTNLDGAAGIRLSMWKISLQLAMQNLWFGFGEVGIGDLLVGSYLNIPENKMAIHDMTVAGPHSDILSKLVSTGLFGLVAYLSLLLVPFSIFWKYHNALDFNVKQAARIGLFYITGVFIAGLSNEQLSLKYLCTFYSLMVAALLAQVLSKSSATEPTHQSSVV